MKVRQLRRAGGRRLTRCALAALAFAGLGSLGTAATADASPEAAGQSGSPGVFSVYDDTFYTNVNLEALGATRSNIVYEAPVAQLAGQNPDQFRGARPPGAELALPPKDAFESLVQRACGNPGPVVLDFETLYLEGPPAVAHRHFQKLQTLLSWAHEAAPGRVIGYYGVLGHTAGAYLGLERSLVQQQDALFPSLSTFGDNPGAWQSYFHHVMNEAAAVGRGKPVYAYLWPQYHGGSSRAGRYLTPANWWFELDTASRLCAGVVIWGPADSDPDQGWVGATGSFLSTGQ